MRTVQKRFEIRTKRVRSKISRTSIRLRLCVTKSNKHIYAQIINDVEYKTLVSVSTRSEGIYSEKKSNCNKDKAFIVGERIGELAKKSVLTK